ncbi:putative membrane protein [Candidatus Campylobacter infans]|uniref:Putative membrane protein n=1 Tax=Candidatus Campylobacter infans TaxID=2561898 RepID=A0A7H9CL80_9BACT|nr:hypothetical protein [Candidatus Campylobacter infans]QLI05559.1 putative membrane protein [Candidatus Campylobacter infans]
MGLVLLPFGLVFIAGFIFLYTYIPYGVIKLDIKAKFKVVLLAFYLLLALMIEYVHFYPSLFLAPLVILTALLFRERKYFQNLANKAIIKRISIAFLFFLLYFWGLEVPQRIIVNLLPVKLEIVNDDFEYIENPEKKFGEKDNIYFEYEKEKKFLNFAYTKNNIYVCDSFDCKGDKKYIGYVWTPWSDAGPLCIDASGRCNRYIKRDSGGRDYLMSFIKNKNNNK